MDRACCGRPHAFWGMRLGGSDDACSGIDHPLGRLIFCEQLKADDHKNHKRLGHERGCLYDSWQGMNGFDASVLTH